MVGSGVNPVVGVLVGAGVKVYVAVQFGVLLGIGVMVGKGVLVDGSDVLVAVLVIVGVGVLDGKGVIVGVQVTSPLWIDDAFIWQPSIKSMISPKSSPLAKGMDPPPGPPSKSNRRA